MTAFAESFPEETTSSVHTASEPLFVLPSGDFTVMSPSNSFSSLDTVMLPSMPSIMPFSWSTVRYESACGFSSPTVCQQWPQVPCTEALRPQVLPIGVFSLSLPCLSRIYTGHSPYFTSIITNIPRKHKYYFLAGTSGVSKIA